MPKLPEILNIETLAQTKLFTIEDVKLRFSNGEERHFERIKGQARGAVMVLPLLDDDTLILIREYGVGLEQYVIAFPRGAVDAAESFEDAANRELMEEAGYEAGHLEFLTEFAVSSAYVSATIKVYVARSLRSHKLDGDEPEPLEVIPWKLSNVDQLLAHPEFIESRSTAALLLLLRSLSAK